ncbi:MAG: hypothetical protein V1776_05025 [Candidatus Diapherotrites archaeon]
MSRVLIPVLHPDDCSDFFLYHSTEDASVVYLLLVLDAHSLSSFGFKTSEIMRGRELVERMKEKIKGNKRLCTDILEWGETIEKLVQIAEMKKVDKICLRQPDNQSYFQQWVDSIKEKTSIPVEIITKA